MTPNQMTPISIGETLSGTWDSGTVSTSTRLKRAYVKYFTFSVDTNISLTISLSSNSADPMLYLLSSDDNKIAENDDASERTYSSQIEETLSPGSYTIEATFREPRQTGSFEISLLPTPIKLPPIFTNIGIGETLSGAWDAEILSTQIDWNLGKFFTFSLAETTQVRISLKSNVESMKNVYLFSGSGTDGDAIAFAESDMGDAEIIETLSPGTYSIEVDCYDVAEFEISLSLAESPITTTQNVTISNLVHKGAVKRTQADEYVEISNSGNSPANISGWKITSAGTSKQLFTFSEGTILEGGKSFRVYTNEIHPETGGFSFGSKTAIWNDAGDEAKLFDAAGNNVSTVAYGKIPSTPS
jgi:hypothetical protein